MNILLANIGEYFGIKQNGAPYRFHGGLALEPCKRALTTTIQELGIPPTLILPLINYAKLPLAPLVNIGDAVLRGQPIATGILAPTSGVVTAIEPYKTIHPDSLQVNSVFIKSDGLDKRISLPHSDSFATRLNSLTAACHSRDNKLAAKLFSEYALAGLGGAGFPTGEKIVAALGPIKTLIINAAECEPEIACDEALMQTEAQTIADGIDAVVKLTKCESCVLAIEDSKPLAIECLQVALKNNDSKAQLMIIPTRYPTGAESSLIKCITGDYIPHNERPSEHGIVCINVATAHAVWQALNDQPLDSRIVSLGGQDMPNPCNVRVRFGTPVSFVLQNTNNESAIKDCRIRAGGPLSGFDLNDLSVAVSAKTNCILAEPFVIETPAQACIRCGQCADVCPAKLLPQQLHWYAIADDLNKCEKLKLDACIECGCCDLVCPSSIKLTETFRYAKSQSTAARKQQQQANDAERRYADREQRVQQRTLAKNQAIEQRKQSIKNKNQPDAAQLGAALARARAKREQAKK